MSAATARAKINRVLIETAIEDVQRERAEIGTCTSGTPAYARVQELARRERHLRRISQPGCFR